MKFKIHFELKYINHYSIKVKKKGNGVQHLVALNLPGHGKKYRYGIMIKVNMIYIIMSKVSTKRIV